MTSVIPEIALEPDDVSVAQQAQQLWNVGNQQGALDALRPKADAGRPWAAALMAWFFMQQGQPGITQSVDWAIRAAQLGAPGQAAQTFNSAIGQIPTNERLGELLELSTPWFNGVDFVGQGWNLLAQGQPELGLRMMMMPSPFPFPIGDSQWKALVAVARKSSADITALEGDAHRRYAEWDAAVGKVQGEIEARRLDFETMASQAELLVTQVTSDATNKLFKEEAERNVKESRGVWIGGLIVLGLAAVVALSPVVLSFFGLTSGYSTLEQVGFHLTSTAALATFAGVLLARARSRDLAGQRSFDLSTAMGTMIAYSSQINDPAEKQAFLMTMGQAILQANLKGSKATNGAANTSVDIAALAAALRPAITSAMNSTQP